MRRWLIAVVACAALCSWLVSAAADTVAVDGGQISGTSAGGVRVFKGISAR